MSTANKSLATRWFEEVWNQRKPKAIEEMLSPDAVVHGLGPDESAMRGPEGFAAFHRAFLDAFFDLKISVEDVIAENDKVAIRWRATGTLKGDGLGLKPTDRPMSVTGMSIVRVRDGMIVEGWNNFDVLGMHQQLGTLTQLI